MFRYDAFITFQCCICLLPVLDRLTSALDPEHTCLNLVVYLTMHSGLIRIRIRPPASAVLPLGCEVFVHKLSIDEFIDMVDLQLSVLGSDVYENYAPLVERHARARENSAAFDL